MKMKMKMKMKMTLKKSRKTVEFVIEELMSLSDFKLLNCQTKIGEWNIHLCGGNVYKIIGSTKEYDKLVVYLFNKQKYSSRSFLDTIDKFKEGL